MNNEDQDFYERVEAAILNYLIIDPRLARHFIDEINPDIFYNSNLRLQFKAFRLSFVPGEESPVDVKKLNDFESKLQLLEKRLEDKNCSVSLI